MLIISWKLSDSEKAPYQEEEKKLRAQYHIEAENWKKRMQEEQEAEKAEKKARKKVDAERKHDIHSRSLLHHGLLGQVLSLALPTLLQEVVSNTW